jgi:hypothetical protein
MSSNGSQILSSCEVRECARALAVMAYRYKPEVFSKFYSATDIAIFLGNIPNGQVSTFHVDITTLKKAFANRKVRKALTLKFPAMFQFSIASTKTDVVTEGPSAFKKGYRISFTMEVEKSDDLRVDIDAVCLFIRQYYSRVEEMVTTKSSTARPKVETNMEDEISGIEEEKEQKIFTGLDTPVRQNEIPLGQQNLRKKEGDR